MLANNDHDPLSKFERIAASVTLKDEVQLAASPGHERLGAMHELVLLTLIWVLQVWLWITAFLTYNVPAVGAFPGGLLVGTIIALLDVKLLASDTAPRGVYRRGPFSTSYFGLLAQRLAISFILSSVTATALDCVVFHDEALQVIQRETKAKNEPILAAYDQKLAALRPEEIGPLEIEISRLTEEHAKALSNSTVAESKIEAAHERGRDAALDHEREIGGVERDKGDGRLAKDAEKRRELAVEDQRFLTARRGELKAAADDLAAQIATANVRLAQARPHYAEAMHKLEAERDGQLQKVTTGPLSTLEGLDKLRADSEQGGTVTKVTVGSWLFVMTLELAYFFARAVFRPASFHDLALNADLRRRAVRLAHEEEADLRAARRPPLHVVGEGDPPRAPANTDRPDDPDNHAA